MTPQPADPSARAFDWRFTLAIPLLVLTALLVLATPAAASHGGTLPSCDWTVTGTQQNGWYNSDVEATLNAYAGDYPIASAEYSADGGTTWTAYNLSLGPLLLPAGGTHDGYWDFHCRVFDTAGHESFWTMVSVDLDSTKPVCEWSNPPVSGWYNWDPSDVDLDWYDPDPSGAWEYSGFGSTYKPTATVDGVAATVGSWGNVQITGEGVFAVVCTVQDQAGNTNSTAFDAKIDVTPPVCGWEYSGQAGTNGWFTTIGKLYLNTTDAASGVKRIQYKESSAPSYTTYTGPISHSSDGSKSFECKAEDNAGNAWTVWFDVKVDTQAPSSCALSYYPYTSQNGWYQAKDHVIEFTSLDPTPGSGIADWNTAYSYAINDVAAKAAWSSTSKPKATEGENTVYCWVKDHAGNEGGPFATTLNLDGTPPVCEFWFQATKGNGNYYLTYGNLSVNFTDGHSGVDTKKWAQGSNTLADYTGNKSITSQKYYDFRCETVDLAGNMGSAWFNFDIDVTPPTCQGDFYGAQGQRGWYHGGGGLNLFVNDGRSGTVFPFQYSVDGAALADWAPTTSPQITGDGTHTVRCVVEDNAGHVTEVTKEIKIDSKPPACSGVFSGTPGAGGWYVTHGNVTLNFTDATSGIFATKYGIAATGASDYTGPFDLLSDGIHRVGCRAEDDAGHVYENMAEIKIDTAAPTACAVKDATASGWTNRNSVGLFGTDATSGVASIRYQSNDDFEKTYGAAFTLEDGEHTIVCTVIDAAGHESQAFTLTIKIDSVRPTCAMTYSGTAGRDGWYTAAGDASLTAEDDGSGVDGISYALDGNAPQVYSAAVRVLGDGTHTLRCMPKDVAGGVGNETFEIKLDAAAPTCTAKLDGPLGADGVYTAGVQITFETADATSGIAKVSYKVGNISKEYGGPFIVSEGGAHNVMCVVEDKAGNRGEVPVQAFTIKTSTAIPGFEALAALGAVGVAIVAMRRRAA